MAGYRRMRQHARADQRGQWLGLARLTARRQFLTMLALASLVTLLSLLTGAYLALRSQALDEEQARLAREATMASALLSTNVQTLSSSPQTSTALSDRISTITGDEAALYQYRGQSLVAVAAHGVDLVGSPLPPAAQPLVVGSCGPVAPVECHQAYSGVMRAGGVEYAATYAPIFDGNGKFSGALMIATPTEDALAGVNSAMVALTAIGTLLALLVIAAGAYGYNRSTGQTLAALQTRLRAIAATSVTMERAAHATVHASRRQEQLARQIGDGARGLDALVTSVNQGYPALQQSAGAIWAEVSHPGAPPDPALVLRFARETTLLATRAGAGMEDARVYSDYITRLMNHVVAQGRVAAQNGQETQRAASELRAAVEHVEAILGGRMVRRNENFSPLSLPSLPALPAHTDAGAARQQPQSAWNASSVWPSRALFPSIPSLPATEMLPTLPTEQEVINGEVRAIPLETPESVRSSRATMAPARYGDVSFPKLMKDASTRPLAHESDSTSATAE
jgi:hypothetical protein